MEKSKQSPIQSLGNSSWGRHRRDYRDQKIRFAVVGCGRISANHFEAIKKHSENAELVAVCDTQSSALEKAVQQTNAQEFSRIQSLLEANIADVIVLCTPSGLHSEHAILAARAGYHVVSEKPMATRWADGKHMVEVFDQNETQLFVVKQNRLNPTVQLLKKAIDQKRFGRIYMVNVNVFWTRPQSYYDQAKWRGTWELDGGAFMNQASHYVDLLDWLIGPVDSVFAFTSTLARNIQVEDTGVVSLQWRSGTLGSMNTTMLTYPKNYEGSITILGEKGTARLGGVALNQFQTWEFQDKLPIDQEVLNSNYDAGSVYGFGHVKYYDNIIQTLRGQAQAETDGREGLKSLELLIAIYLSARDGKKVALPLDLR